MICHTPFRVGRWALPAVLATLSPVPLSALIASGDSAIGIIETVPPSAGVLTVPASASAPPVALSYSGAADAHSGLLEVQLWYRTEATAWAPTGLAHGAGAAPFDFTPPGVAPDNYGAYYFDLVAVDELGNSTAAPQGLSGAGQGVVQFGTVTTVLEWEVLE